jgi:O-antigen/teichoic acid export membrane protein
MDQRRLVARNGSLNLLGFALATVVAFAAIPVTVHALGTERFGLLTLAWLVLGYLGVFDFGLARATTKFVAEALAVNRERSLAHIAYTSLVLMLAVSAVAALALAIAAGVIAVNVLHVPQALTEEATWTLIATAGAVPVTFALSATRAVLEAGQHFRAINLVAAPSNAMTYVLSAVGASLGFPLPAIIALLVLNRLAAAIAFLVVAEQIYPGTWKPSFSMREAKQLINYGRWVASFNFVGFILVYADRFVIGALLGIAAVAYYATPYEMITRLWIVPASFASALFPAFARRGAGERDVLMLYSGILKLIALCVAPVAIIVILFSRELLAVWLGPSFADASVTPLELFALGVFVSSLTHVPMAYLQGSGRPDLITKVLGIEVVLFVPLVVLLVDRFGLAGGAFAWLARVLVDAFVLFALASRHLHATPADEVSKTKRVLLLLTTAILTAYAIAATQLPLTFRLLTVAIIGAAVTVVMIRARLVGPNDRWIAESAGPLRALIVAIANAFPRTR